MARQAHNLFILSHTPPTSARFKLLWKDLLIGELTAANGTWHFAYSDEFRHQDKLGVLANFPQINREYDSDTLWPFFHARIPTAHQPMVQRAQKRSHTQIDTNDEVDMLWHFGQRTVANPYELVEA